MMIVLLDWAIMRANAMMSITKITAIFTFIAPSGGKVFEY